MFYYVQIFCNSFIVFPTISSCSLNLICCNMFVQLFLRSRMRPKYKTQILVCTAPICYSSPDNFYCSSTTILRLPFLDKAVCTLDDPDRKRITCFYWFPSHNRTLTLRLFSEVDVIYIEFSRDFDAINQNIALHKLKWFSFSYPYKFASRYGVPQESCLRPLFFINFFIPVN